MLNSLSYWERTAYFDRPHVLIVGAGYAGLNTAIELAERDPSLKILVVERNFLPNGGSTKNAGFACFGSPSELLEDLKTQDPNEVFQLFAKRYAGIQKMLTRTHSRNTEYQQSGGFELVHKQYSKIIPDQQELEYLNIEIEKVSELKNYFTFQPSLLKEWNLSGFDSIISNGNEATLHPLKLWEALLHIAREKGVHVLFGATVSNWLEEEDGVRVQLEQGIHFKTHRILFCVNGFAKHLFPNIAVTPARNQVLVIQSTIPFRLPGCFHLNNGYIYFRSVDGKLLIGGGRDQDIATEFTDHAEINPKINTYLLDFVRNNLLKDQQFEVIDHWLGIMGLGNAKSPIIEMYSDKIGVAVRMGGMGVAIASLVGKEAADMIYQNIP